MTKIRIDVEDIREAKAVLSSVNSVSLDEIEWYEGGAPLVIRDGAVDEFRFTGLNNVDFIFVEFYNPERS